VLQHFAHAGELESTSDRTSIPTKNGSKIKNRLGSSQLWGNAMTNTEFQLPKVAQTRISRLALASGRSPAAILRFVLRDGFEAVELSIKENAQADAEFAAGATAAHADVMRDALKAVHQAKHAARAAA
jgi:predicted transcriptional regulator